MSHARVRPLTAFILIGIAYGAITTALPAPSDLTAFWLGNLCAPWLVLAFGAGWAQQSGRWAKFLVFDPARLGVPSSTPFDAVVLMTVRQWLTFVGPWLLAAVAGGLLYGLAGWHWGRTRSVVAGVALGLPFVVEPLLWALYHGYVQTPWLLWLAEVILGLALIAFTWVVSSRHARREGLTRSRKPGVGRSG